MGGGGIPTDSPTFEISMSFSLMTLNNKIRILLIIALI
jgi:hypothetical protein